MNGKKAKAIRKKIYSDYSFRFRKYTRLPSGQILADERRRNYQAEKKAAIIRE